MTLAATVLHAASELAGAEISVTVSIDRGPDLGQSFGSLFEAVTDNGEFVVGAGFQNAYNTRYRADRHALQFFVRPTDGRRELRVEELPRPTPHLTGAYLYSRDGTVYSTYGELRAWDPGQRSWSKAESSGGTSETMRVGDGVLAFGDSRVFWNGKLILGPPREGSYQLFFYANGHLCFYHVNRKDAPYRPYKSDEDGFSRLYAVPWTPAEKRVDLSQAVVLRLPIVGETTFAWGQLGSQIVTGSNIGGFYVFEDGSWKMLLEPQLGVSYQLYSTLVFRDRLLMGQYPTGRIFQYDGKRIADQEGWPPVPPGVSPSAREAQTTAIYGGDLMVGVWPWGEVWRYNPDSRGWKFMRRMFDHPAVSSQIVHPYDVENQGNEPRNLWGQRVTSLVPSGPGLFISTSAKAPIQWEPEKYPFLAPDKWKSYGKVYRATMPGHLSVPAKWTRGPTTLRLVIGDGELSVWQDGVMLARSPLEQELSARLSKVKGLAEIKWGSGVYGPHGFVSLDGQVAQEDLGKR